MKTVSAQEMRIIDKEATEKFGIPSIILMENAGRAIADAAVSLSKRQVSARFAIFCGSGNNGGDGLVAARHLHNKDYSVEIILIKSPDDYKGDSLTNYKIVENMNIPALSFKDELVLSDCDVIIDAILGTGTKGEITGIYRQAIEKINSLKKPVISADIPSGIDADTGKVLGAAVHASITVTMGLIKKGLLEQIAKPFVGSLIIADIGLPRQLLVI